MSTFAGLANRMLGRAPKAAGAIAEDRIALIVNRHHSSDPAPQQLAETLGKPVFKAMNDAKPDYISSDCAIAGRHIQQGINDTQGGSKADKQHPLTLLRMAYGL